MRVTQKAGGWAALVQGVVFVLAPINLLVFLPSLGLAGPNDAYDPTKVLPVITSPLLYVGALIQFVLTATILLITLTLYARFGGQAPNQMRLAVMLAVVASTLFLSVGMINFYTLRAFAGIPSDAQAGLVVAVSVVTDGLLIAAITAAGWSFLMWGWAARQAGALPRILSYVVMLAGVCGALTFVVPPFQILGLIFNIVWSFWLGLLLLREAPLPTIAGVARA